MTGFALGVLVLLVLKTAAQLWLEFLNRARVLAHARKAPAEARDFIDEPTYHKSVAYTLAKNRVQRWEILYDAAVLAVVVFSGVLPWSLMQVTARTGDSVFALAGWLAGVLVLFSLTGLPWNWHHQFRLEERFGFNNSTLGTWIADRVKGFGLALLLGYPLLALILKLVAWTGAAWWLWSWGVLLSFQLLMAVLAPALILPLFNKFTPLPEGSLKTRLLGLAKRARFTAKSIQVMDGSRRSKHSNAFFTGFGRLRKIVLFDTLIQQLSEPELEAVLAHEVGHYKRRHIPKMLLFSALSSLAGFFILSILARAPWFLRSFGFAPGTVPAALLLFVLLAGLVTFWFSPLANHWSRKYEYEADAYAGDIMGSRMELVGALRKLTEKNLNNLTPHPGYSAFYYSHPTLLERERALSKLVLAADHLA